MDAGYTEDDMRAAADDYEARIEELEDEVCELEGDRDEFEVLYNEATILLGKALFLKCPVCNNSIVQDAVEGLICRGCRRVFQLQEKK